MPNGGHKQIHANHLRPFTVRIISVIADADIDFGDIVSVSTENVNKLPSCVIDRKLIDHLTMSQQQELLQLLDEFSDCFSDKPGFCSVVQHEINTTPDFVPKQFKPYRIPEVLKPEVEKQIDSLLKDGLIVPSMSDMISPIVCIVKHNFCKPGPMKVRIACDMRYLNKYTRVDVFSSSRSSRSIE